MRRTTLFSSLLTFVGCSSQTIDEQTTRSLENTITEASKTSGHFELRRVDAIQWDRAVIFAPYTPIRSMSSHIVMDQRVTSSGIDSRDDISLIVFLRSDSVISVVLMPRAVLDFAPLAGEALSPADCILISSGSHPKASIGRGCNK